MRLALGLMAFSPASAWAEPGTVTPSDAGAPLVDAGSAAPYAQGFRQVARQIRQFLAGRLDPTVDAWSLFELRLDAPDAALRVERERISLVLDRAADAGRLDVEVEAIVWQSRLMLDRARLGFYELPLERRKALLRDHEKRKQEALAVDHDEAISQAEGDARRAERQRQEALAAARRASTEAARLVNEEHARLLSVTRQQAEYEKAAILRRAELEARNEAVLAWRRRVTEITANGSLAAAARARADVAYTELRTTLREARGLLSGALGAMGSAADRIPQAGNDPLVELPADTDRTVAVRQREVVTAKTRQLLGAERVLEHERAAQLMNEVETLNRLRLELLGSLSPDKRDSVLELGKAGWDQAVAEVWQVVLISRYHLYAALDWAVAIRHGDQRGSSAWLAFSLAMKWAIPIAFFVWWRRRADGLIDRWLEQRREQTRQHRNGDWFGSDHAALVVAFLRRVRRPLEWLLLVGLVTWLMPSPMKALLEVRLASRVLLWVLGGLFIVLSIDALATQPGGRGSGTAQLRLRSLRLVGRAVVAFGLVLTLSDLLVGQGTVYSWVLSTCWLAAAPILFVIIGWWRPFIFERFTGMRKPNGFEGWVLRNREPAPNVGASTQSSLAAVAGGLYLFSRGAVRVVRGRILAFKLTRRLLAYLFRRDLSKKARDTRAHGYAPVSADIFRALGPESGASGPVRSAADAPVKEVIDRIKATGGGSIAIVGERGSGKTTLIERIVAGCAGLVSLTCTRDGTTGLRTQLNEALGLPAATPMERAAQSIDTRKGDRALLIDDAQFLVRPMMGGLAELDAVLSLMRHHSTNCTWVFAFDEAIWRFIERSRGARPLFDHLVQLAPWNEEAIVQLITQRNAAAGLEPDFSELALDLPPNADETDVREAIRRTEANYYRLLWDYADGNPGVALHFWRCSLGVSPSGRMLVRLFDSPDASQLETLPDSSAFVLRAIVQLGWAGVEDIVRSTSLSTARVEDALRYGSQHGCFEVDGDLYRINWHWYRGVTRLLQRRHLSFSST